MCFKHLTANGIRNEALVLLALACTLLGGCSKKLQLDDFALGTPIEAIQQKYGSPLAHGECADNGYQLKKVGRWDWVCLHFDRGRIWKVFAGREHIDSKNLSAETDELVARFGKPSDRASFFGGGLEVLFWGDGKLVQTDSAPLPIPKAVGPYISAVFMPKNGTYDCWVTSTSSLHSDQAR